MKNFQGIWALLILVAALPAWSQVDTTSSQASPTTISDDSGNTNTDTRMTTPPPVSGQSYPIELGTQERSNYLRAGLAFTTAYTDNAIGSINGKPLSDVSYSVAPLIGLDETTTREHLVLTYSPGFTFYQRLSSLNEADQNAAVEFDYRVSPHVTFSARDGFQKSSNVFNQPDLASSTSVSGGIEGTNFSVVAPIADRLGNTGSLGLTYQFSLNGMVGGSGTFSNLHYPNQAQVPGLYDSSSQSGLGFYSLRIAKLHYVGVTYTYQRLLAYPTTGVAETQTQAPFVFYTVFPTKGLSLSLFGGPQYSNTAQPRPLLSVKQWTPAGGASLSWQGLWNSFAVSYVHMIASGGGLIGAVQTDGANASMRQRITRSLNASVGGGYAENNVVGVSASGQQNGHTISGTAALQQQFGQHLMLTAAYTRLRENYSSVAVLAATPNTNRESVSLSYQFARPLGR